MVRRAALPDVDRIVDLINNNLDKLLPRTRDEVIDMLDCFWVSEDDGRVVGCCCLEVYSKKIAEIRSVAVDVEFREKGHGAQLIKAATTEAKQRNIEQVLVVTSTPQYFEQLNFKPCLNEKYALFWNGDIELE